MMFLVLNFMLLRFFHTHWGLDLFVLILLLLVVGLVYLTGKFTLRYLISPLHPAILIALLILHILTSLIAAIILPNNYLCDVESFRGLYQKNGVWIPITMILIFLSLFLIIGILFSFALNTFFPPKKK